jgi:siroheme synthase
MRTDMPAALVENAGNSDAVTSVATVAAFRNGELARRTAGPGILMVGSAIAGEPNTDDLGAAKHVFAAEL